MYIVEQLINGLCQGGIYALIAIGFTLVFGITGLVTFCYGEIVMMGAYGSYFVFQWVGLNVPLAMLGAFLFSAFIGFFVYKICYERFLAVPHQISLLCTIGMSTLLTNLAQLVFGLETKSMPMLMAGMNIQIGEIRITYLQILIIGVVVLLCLFLSWFLNKTRIGAALRSVKQDRVATELLGIDSSRVMMIGNCIGSALGGIAGILYCISYMSISPTLGTSVGRIGFSAAVLGGLVNIPWAAAGGVIIGILENLSIIWIPASFRSGIAYVFLIIVLIFLPQGIASRKKRTKL